MQTAPAAVTSINPDTRPLPPGWSSHVDQTGSCFYVNTSSAPPQFTYNHPLGPVPAQKVPNNVQMTKAQQLYASALSPYLISTPVLGPASPSPPRVALQTPQAPYTSSTGIMSVSHSYNQENQQPQQPALAQAPLTYTGQTPVQKQPTPTATAVYVQTPPPPQPTHNGFFGAPKHTAQAPAIPYSTVSGYTTLVPLQNPNPSRPTAHGLPTANAAGRKSAMFKKFGKVALNIADTTIKATTGVPMRTIIHLSAEVASMLWKVFSSDDVANNLGITQADLQGVLQGAPNANYAAVIQALMAQQQLQQQQGAAAAPESPTVDYAALIAELQKIQALVPGQPGLAGQGMPGQVGFVGQTIPGQVGLVGLNGQVQVNNMLSLPQQNTYNAQVATLGGQQQQGMGNVQTLAQMQPLVQAQALVPSQPHLGLNTSQQPAPGHFVLAQHPQPQLSLGNQAYQPSNLSIPIAGTHIHSAQNLQSTSSTQPTGVSVQHLALPGHTLTQTSLSSAHLPLTSMAQLEPASTSPPVNGCSPSHLHSHSSLHSPSCTFQHFQSLLSQHTHTPLSSSLSPSLSQFQVQVQPQSQDKVSTPPASSYSPSNLQVYNHNQALGHVNSTSSSGSATDVVEASALSVPTSSFSQATLPSQIQVLKQNQSHHPSQSGISTISASTPASALHSVSGNTFSTSVSAGMATNEALQHSFASVSTQAQSQLANVVVQQQNMSQEALDAMSIGQPSLTSPSVQGIQPSLLPVKQQVQLPTELDLHSSVSAAQSQSPLILQQSTTFLQSTQPLPLSAMPTTQPQLLPAKADMKSFSNAHKLPASSLQPQHSATITSKSSKLPQTPSASSGHAVLNQSGTATSSPASLQLSRPTSTLQHSSPSHLTSLPISPAKAASQLYQPQPTMLVSPPSMSPTLSVETRYSRPLSKPTSSQFMAHSGHSSLLSTNVPIKPKPQQMHNSLYQQQQAAVVGKPVQVHYGTAAVDQSQYWQGSSKTQADHQQQKIATPGDSTQAQFPILTTHQQQSTAVSNQAHHQQLANPAGDSVHSPSDGVGVNHHQQQQQPSNATTVQTDDQQQEGSTESALNTFDAPVGYQQQQEQDPSAIVQFNNQSLLASVDQSSSGQFDIYQQQQQNSGAFGQVDNQPLSILADQSYSYFDAFATYQQQQQQNSSASIQMDDQTLSASADQSFSGQPDAFVAYQQQQEAPDQIALLQQQQQVTQPLLLQQPPDMQSMQPDQQSMTMFNISSNEADNGFDMTSLSLSLPDSTETSYYN